MTTARIKKTKLDAVGSIIFKVISSHIMQRPVWQTQPSGFFYLRLKSDKKGC